MGPKGAWQRDWGTADFADLEGYVGAFDNVYPPETESTNQIAGGTVGSSSSVTNDDHLVDDSLLMEVSKSL